MRIMGTHFQRTNVHKETWMIAGINSTNRYNHSLIQEKDSDLITKVKTYFGTDSDSDHFLVAGKLKQRRGVGDNKTQHTRPTTTE